MSETIYLNVLCVCVCVWQVMSEIYTKEFAIVVTSHEHVVAVYEIEK